MPRLRAPPLLPLLCGCTALASAAVPADVPAARFWASFANTASLPTLPPHHPSFVIEGRSVQLLGSAGPYFLPVSLVRDAAAGNAVVMTYVPRTSFAVQTNASENGELNLLGPTPDTLPLDLPDLPRYGWAWLYGAKATTYTWLDCCSVTGDEHGTSLVVDGPDNATVTLTEFQRWLPNGTHAGRDALSNHTFTLRWDATYGYVVDAQTALRINAKAAPSSAEFLNFLPPRLMQPWPTDKLVGGGGGFEPLPFPRSNMTAYANDTEGRAWVGFANNILAGAELRTYDMPAALGGTVFASPTSPGSPAIAFGAEDGSGIAFRQATCPTWADQHQIVVFPPSPGPDGYFDVSPTFSIRFLPTAGCAYLYGGGVTTLLHAADGSGQGPPPGVPASRWLNSTLVRVGVVESFESDPVPLTSPLRALGQSWSSPDNAVLKGRPGTGRGNSTAALLLEAMAEADAQAPYAFSNPQPLIPLNASDTYAISAWFSPLTNGTFEAFLWVGIYEADDFNAGIAPGPGFGRITSFYSTVLECVGGACGAGDGARRWVREGAAEGAVEEVEPGVLVSPALRGRAPRLAHRRVEKEEGREGAASWTKLDVGFVAPPWVSYADVRVFVTVSSPAAAGDAPQVVLVDDFFFGQGAW